MRSRRPTTPGARPPRPQGPGTRPSHQGPQRRHEGATDAHVAEDTGATGDAVSERRTVAWRGERGTPAHSLRLVAIALFAILAVIIVAPTFSKYLAAQQELSEARSDLADSQARVESLQHELDLWNDKDYVKTQARERLGYVMPGQTLYVVSEPSEGTAQEKLEQKVAEVNRDRRAATPWFSTLVDSISVAGQAGELDNPNSVPIVTPDGGTTTSDPTVAPTTAPSSSPVQ